MPPTVARIFVSSTWLDLQPERHAVEDAINRMNAGKFVGMEYFGSRRLQARVEQESHHHHAFHHAHGAGHLSQGRPLSLVRSAARG